MSERPATSLPLPAWLAFLARRYHRDRSHRYAENAYFFQRTSMRLVRTLICNPGTRKPEFLILNNNMLTSLSVWISCGVSEEVTFEHVIQGPGRISSGYRKIRFCGEQGAKDGLQYLWVDTSCINMSRDVELSDSIASMFHNYQQAPHRVSPKLAIV